MINNKNHGRLFSILALFLAWTILPFSSADALPQPRQTTITSPSQLIDAVNGVRASYGLSPLTVHTALMQSAQSQADYMAATGQITHTRPGGITYTQQLISLGFPLAGEIRSENILSSGGPLVWNGVPPAWQDSVHMNTMISPSNTHIGAGISQGAGGYYYAVDCAAASGSGEAQTNTSTTAGTPGAAPAVSQYIVPVIVSTARPDGNVYHVLQYGQTLWSVAIEYGTTIREIQALNGLGDDLLVWQGQELLVKRGATQPAPPTSTSTRPATATSVILPTLTTLPTSSPTAPVATPTATLSEASASNFSSSSLLVGILIVAALVGGGVAVWLIRDPNSN
jgi:LysM repeat protein